MKLIKKVQLVERLPRGIITWVDCLPVEGICKHYYITSTKIRDEYDLYLVVEGGYQLIATANSPLEFDEIIYTGKW